MTGRYVLDDQGNPVPETDPMVWARWFADVNKRRLAMTDLPGGGYVSTVFLGLDHGWSDGPPALWETMVFGVTGDETQERYTSHDDALAGHEAIVARLSSAPAPARQGAG